MLHHVTLSDSIMTCSVYYNNKMNAGVAIFTLIGSQLLGYGYAGLLYDILVKPTKCFWPANSTFASVQLIHRNAP